MGREIEAKFRVGENADDREAFGRLLALGSLGGYTLEEGHTRNVYDRYVDTEGHDFLEGDFACRMRKRDDEELVTIKGLAKAKDEVHRRAEYEAPTGGSDSPHEWPESEARELAIEIACSSQLKELSTLFVIRQVRHEREVLSGDGRVVAEMSLDEVDFGEEGSEADVEFVLEVELLPGGTEDDLAAISRALRENPEWRLIPDPLSKFERALQKKGIRL